MLFLVLVADFISVGIQCPVNNDFSFANTDSETEYAITTEDATEKFHYNCTVGNISHKKLGDIDVGDGCQRQNVSVKKSLT